MTATFSISLPPKMAEELERVRRDEHRTRSELVREALRHYIRVVGIRSMKARIAKIPDEKATADELETIEEGRAEFRVGKHVAFEELRHELHGTRVQK